MSRSGKKVAEMHERFRVIGAALKEAREARGLTYAQVAEECKVQEKYLHAVESGHTDTLPMTVYFPLFSRAFAQVVGLDLDELVGKFVPEVENEVEVTEKPSVAPTAHPSRITPPVSISRLATRMTPEAPFSWYKRSKGARNAARVAVLVLVVGAAYAVVRYGVMSDGYAREAERPREADSAAAPIREKTQETIAYSPQQRLKLTVRASDSSWVLLTADGDTIFNRDLKAGETVTLVADYRFRITSADARGLELYIDGQRLKPLPGSDVRDFEINQLNFQDLLLNAPLEATVTHEPR